MSNPTLPVYKEAAYGGESVTLENKHIKLVFHRRVNGWGWGELYAPSSQAGTEKLMGVLEYFGEVDVVGHHYPLRLDGESYALKDTKNGQKLSFDLELQLPQGPWMCWDNFKCIEGKVEFELDHDSRWVKYSLFAKPKHRLQIRSIRGIWLKVGCESFGAEKEDSIFPGIEWLEGKEWSNGTQNHPQMFTDRVTPHPRKVTCPLMTISHEGMAVGVSWQDQRHNRLQEVQPVFACPDFIDRRDQSVIGLMYPSVTWGLKEGELKADPPIYLPRRGVEMRAEIGMCAGTSLDMLTEWIKLHGLPDPGPARYGYSEILEKIASAYNSNLWFDECTQRGAEKFHGFWRSWHLAPCQPFLGTEAWQNKIDFCKRIPSAVDHYIAGNNNELAKELEEKKQWCVANSKRIHRTTGRFGKNLDLLEWFNDDELRQLADDILTQQQEDGNIPFQPLTGNGVAGHFKAAGAWKPLGQAGETSVSFCATNAFLLMMVGDILADEKYLAAARKALDFAMPLDRPEGAEWWETPLHSPNTLSAGYMALAYYVGWSLFEDEKYLSKAIRSIRSLLPFTSLWETGEFKMTYQPKPLFGTTAWHAIDWCSRSIMWQILTLFEMYGDLGIDWAEIDTEIDWATFQKGITHAGLRWIVDSKDQDWMKNMGFNEREWDKLLKGGFDMMVPDNYDPVENKYYDLIIPPDTLASNVLQVMERSNK